MAPAAAGRGRSAGFEALQLISRRNPSVVICLKNNGLLELELNPRSWKTRVKANQVLSTFERFIKSNLILAHDGQQNCLLTKRLWV